MRRKLATQSDVKGDKRSVQERIEKLQVGMSYLDWIGRKYIELRCAVSGRKLAEFALNVFCFLQFWLRLCEKALCAI